MNNSEVTISADELFYLGKLMHAKYIDYAYIVCLNDSQEAFRLREKTVKQGLIKRELLFESFSGKTEAEETLSNLLWPVFYGTTESSLNYCTIGDQAKADIIKFHFLKENITLVKAENGYLTLKKIVPEDFERIVSELFSDDSDFSSETLTIIGNMQDVSELVSVKRTVIGKESAVYVFVKSKGIWYMDKGYDHFESISRNNMIDCIVKVLKG